MVTFCKNVLSRLICLLSGFFMSIMPRPREYSREKSPSLHACRWCLLYFLSFVLAIMFRLVRPIPVHLNIPKEYVRIAIAYVFMASMMFLAFSKDLSVFLFV